MEEQILVSKFHLVDLAGKYFSESSFFFSLTRFVKTRDKDEWATIIRGKPFATSSDNIISILYPPLPFRLRAAEADAGRGNPVQGVGQDQLRSLGAG
jgi:hypothetical protein